MKIEHFIFPAMNDEKHGLFYKRHITSSHQYLNSATDMCTSSGNNNEESIEQDGCCYLLLAPTTTATMTRDSNSLTLGIPTTQPSSLYLTTDSITPVRRVKSTPDLLQIPNVRRNRKKSDDSAMESQNSSCSNEEYEYSDKSSTDVSEPELYSNNSKLLPSSSIDEPEEPPPSPLSDNDAIQKVNSLSAVLRPPSVVVSDHDLSPGGDTFVTFDELNEAYNISHFGSMNRRLSDCSTCSSLSFDGVYGTTETESHEEIEEYDSTGKKISNWKKIKTIVHQLTPFIQSYKNLRYQWVQLAGHQGNFKPGEHPGTILKKFCDRERDAFEQLMNDSLKPFIPKYYGVIPNDNANPDFIQLEDLLAQFNNPCVMDCKLGIRTYLEEELIKAKEKPKLRKDMYEKMCQIDPNAPTAEERQLRGVTKPRYMVWRETISTTSTLGYRVEGVRMSNGYSSKDFKTTRSESQVKEAFRSFIKGFSHTVPLYLERLRELKAALAKSQFFSKHEVIGSSLLFVHDESSASIWMIDFAKTCPLPEGIESISHDKEWMVGNHEDGYLIGLSNLIKIFEEISQDESSAEEKFSVRL